MNNMVIALQITALGMGLVFAAIILLWWMMDLLTLLTADKQPISDSAETSSVTNEDLKAQAAAVAVAIAVAIARTPHNRMSSSTAAPSRSR